MTLFAAFLCFWPFCHRHVQVPMTAISIPVPYHTRVRLWINAVEFDHRKWAEICYSPDFGKTVKRTRLKSASPLVGTEWGNEPEKPTPTVPK